MMKQAIRAGLAVIMITGLAHGSAMMAQDAPINGVKILYGDKERCPTDASGNEIVVCQRRPAAEQFRIPKELRPKTIKPEYESWVERQESVLEVGDAGSLSCSTVGLGGSAGCAKQQFRTAKRENKVRKVDEQVYTDPVSAVD